jgi:hypothetical protein
MLSAFHPVSITGGQIMCCKGVTDLVYMQCCTTELFDCSEKFHRIQPNIKVHCLSYYLDIKFHVLLLKPWVNGSIYGNM